MSGRPSNYLTAVKSRFDEIQKWLGAGATERECAQNLGIAMSTWCKYKNEHKEFMEFVKRARKKPVTEIKAAMFRRAKGFFYTEEKVTTNENGETKTETFRKYAMPDTTAQLILLKHWAKNEGWTSDPQTLELKKRELKLREKQAKNNDW